MANYDFPHVLPVEWEDVVFDRAGIGATARSSINAALWVAMRPSAFLSIATPLPVPRASLEWLRGRIEDGDAIAPAELHFNVAGKMPLALSHEGRHRMTALRDRLSDRPVPVRLSFQGISDCELNDDFVRWVRSGSKSQRGRSVVDGPIFGEAEIDLGGRWPSGVPPGGAETRRKRRAYLPAPAKRGAFVISWRYSARSCLANPTVSKFAGPCIAMTGNGDRTSKATGCDRIIGR